MSRQAWMVVASALLLLTACNDPVPEKTPRKRALESITSDVFVPMLGEVHHKAQELDEAARKLCEPDAHERSARQLDAARQAWGDACEVWKRTDVMSFGPHLISPYRFAAEIDFWPAREGSIDALLAGQAQSSDDDAGAEPVVEGDTGELPMLPNTLTASQKGLPAIEYLLFGPREQTLAAFQNGARGEHRCAYLRAMTDALMDDAAELERVFREDFGPDFTLANSPNDRYSSVNEAFGELVNNMIFAVETVRGTRLAKPLGITSGGAPQPDQVELRYSGESIRAASAVLDGVADVFFGRNASAIEGGEPIYGVHSVLKARDIDLSSQYSTLHQAAVVALEEIPEPLREAVVDDPESVQTARDAVTDLLMLLQVDIAQALSVTATFGRNDGDGD